MPPSSMMPCVLLAAGLSTTACVSDVWSGRRCPTQAPYCSESAATPDGGLDAGDVALGPAGGAACRQCDAGVAELSRCVAGRYEGAFSMAYRSGPAGLCGLVAQVNGGIAAGRWTFELPASIAVEQPKSQVLEGICLLAGADADGEVTDSGTPLIRARLTGSLDCATGELRSVIEGTYVSTSVCDLGSTLAHYFFRGHVTGTYDMQRDGFVAGRVQWNEPAVLVPPQPGGEGTWNAQRKSDAVDTGDLRGDCLGGVTFPEAMFADGGA